MGYQMSSKPDFPLPRVYACRQFKRVSYTNFINHTIQFQKYASISPYINSQRPHKKIKCKIFYHVTAQFYRPILYNGSCHSHGEDSCFRKDSVCREKIKYGTFYALPKSHQISYDLKIANFPYRIYSITEVCQASFTFSNKPKFPKYTVNNMFIPGTVVTGILLCKVLHRPWPTWRTRRPISYHSYRCHVHAMTHNSCKVSVKLI